MRPTYILNGIDRSDEIVTTTDSPRYAFPEALPRDDALRDEALTGMCVPDRLDDADFQVTHAVRPGTFANADAVAAFISDRVRAYAPEATFFIAEEGKRPLIGRVRTAWAIAHENHKTWGFVTIKGRRYGPWEDVETPALDDNGAEIIETAVTLGEAVHVRGTKGEMPARLRSKLTLDDGGDTAGLGFFPGAFADIAALQDYADATITMDGDFAAIGTASTFDVNAYRGKWLVTAKGHQTSTTEGATSFRAASAVKGSGIDVTGTYPGQPVAATKLDNSEELLNLGVLPAPGVEVPDVETGAGYGSPTVDANNTTAASLFDMSAHGFRAGQSFPVTLACWHAGFRVKAKDIGGTGGMLKAYLYAAASDIPANSSIIAQGTVAVASGTDGEVSILWDSPFVVPAAGNYFVSVTCSTGDIDLYYSTASSYAGGKLATYAAPFTWTASATNDLYFKSLIQLPLGFDASMVIEATCSEASKDAYLHSVTLVPAAFCALVRGTFAAGQGPMIDNMPAKQSRRLTYLSAAGAGNIAPGSGLTTLQPGFGCYLPTGDSECITVGSGDTGKLSLWCTPLYATRGQ